MNNSKTTKADIHAAVASTELSWEMWLIHIQSWTWLKNLFYELPELSRFSSSIAANKTAFSMHVMNDNIYTFDSQKNKARLW